MAFLVEETLGNFDFRILRVSVSLGTKFQRNRLVLIRAQAGLRKGVVASAISSMQTVWWGRSRLAYPGVTLFLASAELLCWGFAQKMENQATGCAGIVENARQSHTWQWASGHVRSRSEECMWRVLGGWRKLQKIARFSFPLLLKRKKYFTNPSCLPHWQRKASPRSTALVRRIGLQPIPPHTLSGIPHWARAPPPPSKLTLAFDRRFGNTRDRFLNEQNHLSYQKLHIRKRLVLLMLLKNR